MILFFTGGKAKGCSHASAYYSIQSQDMQRRKGADQASILALFRNLR
jgi:hypothetical protein